MRTTYLLPMLIVASALSGCAAPVLMGAAAAGAVVVNQDERDRQTIATDEKIELNAAEIARRDVQLTQSAHLNFTSVNGVVLITGEAPASEPLDKLKAEIARLDKVREVRNEVVIGPVSSMGSRSQDSWITTKVKSRMVAEKNLRTGSPHDRKNINCSTCHTVHAEVDPINDREDQAAICNRCHRKQITQHPRFEARSMDIDALACSACHDVHRPLPQAQ